MAIVYPGLVQAETNFYTYTITNSVWLDGSADQLTFSPGAGNRDTWTFSCWLKRTGTGTGGAQVLFNGGSDGNNLTRLELTAADKLRHVHLDGGSVTDQLVTTAVFRDVGSWYHIILAVDTGNGAEANRVRLYVNGVEITALDTANYPASGADTDVNDSASTHRIGTNQAASGEFLNAYIADVHFIDGQQHTPSDFGEFKKGIWVPKSYSGSYGTNGFHLDFANSGALGTDASGEANDWTPNSMSSANQSADTPTNNCPVMNLTDPAYSTGLPTVTGDGNLTIGYASAAYRGCRGTVAIPSTGKWAFQVTINGTPSPSVEIPFGIMSYPDQGGSSPHQFSNNHVFVYPGGAGGSGIYKDGSQVQTPGAIGSSSVCEVLVDMDAGTVDFKDDGAAYGTQVTGLDADVEYWPFGAVFSSSAGLTFDFGQNGYTPSDSDYQTLLPANMAEPPTDSWPYHKVFDILLYAGDGSTSDRAITMPDGTFTPGLAWHKERSTGNPWSAYDVLRGAGVRLQQDAASAEVSENEHVSFDAGGMTVKRNATYDRLNFSARDYAFWCWALGIAFSGSTTGSGTSKGYGGQYNTANGMAVITYEGNGTAGHTIPLPSAMTTLYGAPKMVITKNRGATGAWMTWHEGLTSAAYYVQLDSAAAQASGANAWNSVAPSSSVVTLGDASATNADTNDYVMYVFWEVPGFSKAITYTSNNATDGVFVNCGFRPGWMIGKRRGATTEWWLFDSKRVGYNVDNNFVYPSAPSGEQTTDILDLVSTGIKFRTNGANYNGGTDVYIGWAFAEQPLKYANAR